MRIIGLINNAIIDWFLPWPEQALYAVSTSLLSEDVSSLSMSFKWFVLFIDNLIYIYSIIICL